MENVWRQDARGAAEAAAEHVASALRAAIEARGRATLALSGGKSPLPMFAALARADVRWSCVDVFQVDERIAPAGDVDRNATSLKASFVEPASLPPARVHLMPVEEVNLVAAAAGYERLLEQLAGTPPEIDVVHLGLGADGHTASLVLGDPALEERTAAVALTGEYQGRRRMTLTFPVLDRARQLVWLVTGADKAAALAQLQRSDPTIPAGRVSSRNAVVFTDVLSHGTSDSFSNGT